MEQSPELNRSEPSEEKHLGMLIDLSSHGTVKRTLERMADLLTVFLETQKDGNCPVHNLKAWTALDSSLKPTEQIRFLSMSGMGWALTLTCLCETSHAMKFNN